jgi:homoserine/homoserine lactone efflux protein
MTHDTWTLWLALSLAAVLTPGPAMLAILGHALARGGLATLPVVLGNAAGAVLLIGASVAGLSAVLAALPHGLDVLKWAGAAYLFWLGLRAWRSMGAVDAPATAAPETGTATIGRAFARGLLIALSNPKALLFFGAVMPQFVDPAAPAARQFAVMAATFAVLELAVTATVALAAQALGPILRRAGLQGRIDRVGAAVMIAAAALVALVPLGR